MAIQKLSTKKEKYLIKLLKKIKLPAPYPVFLALCKSVPIIAVDIALIKEKNRLLLTYRDDESYKGWHIPGSILTYQEKPIQAFYRVAKKELGLKLKDLAKIKFQTYFSYRDPRENGIVLLFTASSKAEPKDGKYFHLDNLPKDLLKEQIQETKYLKDLVARH